MENKKQLEERMVKLENKLTIKDDTKNKRWFIDNIVNEKRIHIESRYAKYPKEEALDTAGKDKFKGE